MRWPGSAPTQVWALLLIAGGCIVARAHYTTDLSVFLPRTPTAMQRLLVDQLRQGIGSRLILIGVEGADAPARARISLQMATRLRASGLFVSVDNGVKVGSEAQQALLFEHRYLLSDAVNPQHFTAAGLRHAIEDTLDLLASPAGLLAKTLLPRDPTGEMLHIIDRLGSERQPRMIDGAWASRDGERALLVAQTRAAGSDTDGQERALQRIRADFTAATQDAGPLPQHPTQTVAEADRLEMSGPGVFSVAARATIKHEVMRLSLLSTALIMILLLSVYRSLPALGLGLVPVASGAVAGVAAVALGFGAVHGITLGFGVTLIGESVDYSIYLFIQSHRAHTHPAHPDRAAAWQGSNALWSTIRLGVLTSICGFASLLPSAFPGLAQLGLYSISGLIAAALVTRFVLPNLLPANFTIRDVSPLGRAFARSIRRLRPARALLILVPVLAAIVLWMHRGPVWNRELSALSPISAQQEALDALLRGDLGAPDARYLVVVSAGDRQSVLRAAEQVGNRLEQLLDAGVIGGFESPTRYLPSEATQRARQASLPGPAQLRERLQAALVGLPIRIERLEPFLHDVAVARTQRPLTRADLEGTSLAAGVDALLLTDGQTWSALLPLRAAGTFAIDLARVHSAVVAAAPGKASVLDVKAEVDRLYSSYLSEVVRLSLFGFAGIVVLLLLALHSPLRVVRVVTPLALAVLAVAAGLLAAGQELTLLHVIGMLLIVAVGSNYALFFDRSAHSNAERSAAQERTVALTLASLLIANAATVVGFGVLGSSSVPVLKALGQTVAPGAFLALLFSAVLAPEMAAANLNRASGPCAR